MRGSRGLASPDSRFGASDVRKLDGASCPRSRLSGRPTPGLLSFQYTSLPEACALLPSAAMDKLAVTWLVFVVLTGLAAVTMLVVNEVSGRSRSTQPRVLQMRAVPVSATQIRACTGTDAERQLCIDRIRRGNLGRRAR